MQRHFRSLLAVALAAVAAPAQADDRGPRRTPEPSALEAHATEIAQTAMSDDAAGPTDAGPTDAEAPAAAEPEGLEYQLEIVGADDDLTDRLRNVSFLESRSDRTPAGRAGLIRRVEEDLEQFAALLKSEGRYAYALSHRIDFEATPAQVRIEVTPGPVYSLASFVIAYDDPDGEGLVVDPARLGVDTGGPAVAKPVSEAPPKLLRLLGEAGYPLAKLKQRSAVVDHGAEEMRVRLEIAEGPRVKYGQVLVDGAEHVDPDYIVRVANLEQGAQFDVAQIDEARRRLFATGLFEGLQLKWPDAPDADGRLDVTVEAEERDRRTISLGLNYSTTEGAGADAQWTHRNIFGRDEDLTFTLRAAELVQSARAELAAPNFLRLDQRVYLASEVAREDTDAFEERRLLAETGLSRAYGQRWRLGGGGELALVETIENDETEQNIVVAFPLTATYDGADDPFDPSKGFKLDFLVEPAAVTLDNTDFFATLSAGGSVYQRLTGDRTLIAAARAKGAVILGPGLGSIPAGRRLYAGGGGSIRGYEFQSVSPLDEDGDPDGGRSLAEFGAELRWRITEDIGIVPFIDGGAAFEDALPDLDGFQYAAGLGLRYYTAVGPLRLDVATPLNPRDNDNIIELYISLGQAF